MKYTLTAAALVLAVASLGWTLTTRSSADGLCEACNVVAEGQPIAWTKQDVDRDL